MQKVTKATDVLELLFLRLGCQPPVFSPVHFPLFRYAVDKSNKRHLEPLLLEGKKKIMGYLKAHGASDKSVQSVNSDRFTGHPFTKF